jgi:hypothetical protein
VSRLTTVCVANVSPFLDLSSDDCELIVVFHSSVVDLSIVNDNVMMPIVVSKRCIVDLSMTNDDVKLPIIKRQRRLNGVKE